MKSYEKMKEHEMDGADYPLSLASDMVLPWPWSLQRFINNVSRIGSYKGSRGSRIIAIIMLSYGCLAYWLCGWRKSFNNGWHSGRRRDANPEHVYDMSWLFELVRTDGNHWFVDDHKVEAVKSGRSAAVFEIGRLLVEGA